MRFEAQLFGPDSPSFISEYATSAVLDFSADALEINWQLNDRQLVIKARRQRELLFCGQLLAGAGQLPLGKVFIEPNDTVFSWNINILDGHDENGDSNFRKFLTLLLQPVLGPANNDTLLICGGQYYLTGEQCQALISDYFTHNPSLWALYYQGCQQGGLMTSEDLLALALFKNCAGNLPAAVTQLWDDRTLWEAGWQQITVACAPDAPGVHQLFCRLLQHNSSLTIAGASVLLARHLPESVPLLTAEIQSWYYSLDNEEAVKKVLVDIAGDIARNSSVLATISYNGLVMPAAQLWSVILLAICDLFAR